MSEPDNVAGAASRVKSEDVPEMEGVAPDDSGTDPPSTRGRGRGRGRGRRVAPRAVPRKKPPTRVVVVKDGSGAPRGGGGPGRLRGRGGPRGRGRGRGGGNIVADADQSQRPSAFELPTLGLGQIAPRKTPATPASQRSGASKNSSAAGVSQASSVGASAASRLSFGSLGSGGGSPSVQGAPGIDFGYTQGAYRDGGRLGGDSGGRGLGGSGGGGNGGHGGVGGGSSGGQGRAEMRDVPDFGYDGDRTNDYNTDSDDELEDTEIGKKNTDIADRVGVVSDDGLLLPVSLPNMFAMSVKDAESDSEEKRSPEVREKTRRIDNPPQVSQPVAVKTDSVLNDSKSAFAKLAKPEPVEMIIGDDLSEREGTVRPQGGVLTETTTASHLDPMQFPAGTPARHILSSEITPFFAQLPGLLPLQENRAAWPGAEIVDGTPAGQWQPAQNANIAIREKESGLGIDWRVVQEPGESRKIGRIDIFRSGKARLVFLDGMALDIDVGAEVTSLQQLLCMTVADEDDGNTCEELANAIRSRLVLSPASDSLMSYSGITSVKDEATVRVKHEVS